MKKILVLSTTLLFLFTGCSVSTKSFTESITNKLKKESIVDNNLPIPYELKNISTETTVSLEWLLEDKYKVEAYNIYRSELPNKKLELVKTIDNKYTTHFVDKGLKPNTKYVYKISSKMENRESPTSLQLITVTNPVVEPITFLSASSNLPHLIKIMWRPQMDNRVKGYIVEKKVNGQWKEQITILNKVEVEYIDNNLDNNEYNEYRVITLSLEDMKSQPSEIVKGKSKKLPNVVRNVTVTQDLPKRIKIEWSKNTEKDIVGYNIYSSTTLSKLFGKVATKKIHQAKVDINSVVLKYKEDGLEKDFYVTAIDRDGLESEMQEQGKRGETKKKQLPPKILNVERIDGNIYVSWMRVDGRNVGYEVKRIEIENMFNKNETIITNITDSNFLDTNVKKGYTYEYSIYGVDKDGIKSVESESKEIEIPEK